MKLNTSIDPRRDGTVIVRGDDGALYVFKAGDDGLLVCDVADQDTVARLLHGGNFYPAEEGDFQLALSLVKPAEGEDQGEDDDDDDDSGQDALPVEAATPPAPKARGRKGKAA